MIPAAVQNLVQASGVGAVSEEEDDDRYATLGNAPEVEGDVRHVLSGERDIPLVTPGPKPGDFLESLQFMGAAPTA